MFLRNQFKSVGMFKLPLVKKQEISLEDVKLIGYDKVNQSDDYDKIVHFFLTITGLRAYTTIQKRNWQHSNNIRLCLRPISVCLSRCRLHCNYSAHLKIVGSEPIYRIKKLVLFRQFAGVI